jgi:lipopolysaccharide/colanic/teichoic acid biosynthesis glycosyltransferase
MEVSRHAAQGVKRAVDVVGAAALLVLTAPILLLAIACVQLVSPGPSFFKQTRVGYRQSRFSMYKLRTMVVDAEAQLVAHLERCEKDREEWIRFRRLRRDPRIIPYIGGPMRRLSVDELPQLWNVIKGDMSLVGPRPLEMDVADAFKGDRLERRAQVRPGLTGLWQVSGRSETDIRRMIELDDEYVTRWSVALDLSILARTPRIVVSRRGAF